MINLLKKKQNGGVTMLRGLFSYFKSDIDNSVEDDFDDYHEIDDVDEDLMQDIDDPFILRKLK